MKRFSLFKSLGALVTAVAVLVSMGTVAFATDPAVSITSATIEPTSSVVNGNGVYEVTVNYTSSNVGDKGVTMLAYTKGSTTDTLATEPLTPYKDGYTIAYVTQENPTGPITFNVDTTGQDAIQVGKGEKILILLGGDGVTNPAATMVNIPWDATKIVIKDFEGFGSPIDVNLDAETIEEAFEDEIKTKSLYVADDNGNEALVDWTNAGIVIAETTPEEKTNNGDATHKATITVGTSVTLTGVTIPIALTKDIFFSANQSWTAETLTVATSSFTLYKDAIAEANTVEPSAVTVDMIKTAALAKVKEGAITVSRTTPALEADVAKADITVDLNTEDSAFNGAAADAEVKFDVVLATGSYNYDGYAVNVGAEGLKATVAVNYQLETPDAWTVTSATYTGEAIADIAEAKADSYDFAGYAEDALNGKSVTLSGSEGNSASVVLGTDVDYTVETSVGTPGADDIAIITATVTITATDVIKGSTTITIPDGITFNTTFTSKMETVKYGDVTGEGDITMDDAIMAMQIYMTKVTPTAKQLKAADVNGVDGVTMDDAILIMQRYMTKIPSFPVEQ